MYHYSQHSAALQPAVPENFKMPILDQAKPRVLEPPETGYMSTSSILWPSPMQLRPPKCPASPPSHHNLHGTTQNKLQRAVATETTCATVSNISN